eukprot:3995148-Prymnesium_polylepis.1
MSAMTESTRPTTTEPPSGPMVPAGQGAPPIGMVAHCEADAQAAARLPSHQQLVWRGDGRVLDVCSNPSGNPHPGAHRCLVRRVTHTHTLVP